MADALGTFQESSAAVEAAKAKVKQAELNLGYCTIMSPVTGLSSFAVQQEGAYVGMGTGSLLTYVAQLDPLPPISLPSKVVHAARCSLAQRIGYLRASLRA